MISLTDGMLLYHGSYAKVENIDLKSVNKAKILVEDFT